ncbi:Transcriptional activator protein LysR [Collimonas arenae]|uniref:Transcriptional activator protein LysR n=1 Tax=Collimonas arenae TaxID=279058 RepID=A0A0A1F7I6_9BURK|nr:LysR family transcriptional regulator [Collimonas arenae]AIY40496.1 Transcriptional activator protein LysR [Collimonas arenae]
MSITLRHIEVFRAVMTTGSVTAAAALLRTSQPTVSRELARFESLVRIKLFDRVRGRLVATAPALTLYEEVRRSYLGLERIVSMAGSIRQFEHGQLSVICLPTFAQTLLPAACRRFLDKFPTVGLSITPQESPLLEESLTSQRYDIGITETVTAPAATLQTLLFSGDMVCVLPDGHPLLAKQKLTPRDFSGQSFINLSLFDVYRQQLDEVFERHGVERRMVIETASAASVCAMVRQGLGVAIVNPLTAMDETGRGLHLRRFSESIPFNVSLVRPEHRPSSMLADAFADAIQQHCRLLADALKRVLRKSE